MYDEEFFDGLIKSLNTTIEQYKNKPNNEYFEQVKNTTIDYLQNKVTNKKGR